MSELQPGTVLDHYIVERKLGGGGMATVYAVRHQTLRSLHALKVLRFHEQTVVLDFGIARVLGAEGTRLTQAGAFMGTCCYMSPEQLRGEPDLTPRSNIFALGATLYELATRRICFDGDNLFAIMERIRSGQYVPPEQAHPGLDPGLAVTIKRALAQEPEQRFQDCAAFRTALQQPASVASVVPSPPAARSPRGPGRAVRRGGDAPGGATPADRPKDGAGLVAQPGRTSARGSSAAAGPSSRFACSA